MSGKPVKRREWIADLLEQLPMVDWDRFVVYQNRHDEHTVEVYGWIDREDEYKDFVLARFWTGSKQVQYVTSSAEYEEKILAAWFGEDAEPGNSCRRVEHTFDVENAVELHSDATLDQFAEEGSA